MPEGDYGLGRIPPAWYIVYEKDEAVVIVVDYYSETSDETNNILLQQCRECLYRTNYKQIDKSEAETLSEIGEVSMISVIEMISWQVDKWDKDVKPKAKNGNKLWGYVLNTLDEMRKKIDAHRNTRS